MVWISSGNIWSLQLSKFLIKAFKADFSSEFAKKFNLQVGYLHKAKISPDEMSSFLKEYDATFELIAEEFVKKIDN